MWDHRNENLNLRLRCKIADRGGRIFSGHIESMCLGRECRYRPGGCAEYGDECGWAFS